MVCSRVQATFEGKIVHATIGAVLNTHQPHLQWCQLESLRVLFYEAKVPSSDSYSTI